MEEVTYVKLRVVADLVTSVDTQTYNNLTPDKKRTYFSYINFLINCALSEIYILTDKEDIWLIKLPAIDIMIDWSYVFNGGRLCNKQYTAGQNSCVIQIYTNNKHRS